MYYYLYADVEVADIGAFYVKITLHYCV